MTICMDWVGSRQSASWRVETRERTGVPYMIFLCDEHKRLLFAGLPEKDFVLKRCD